MVIKTDIEWDEKLNSITSDEFKKAKKNLEETLANDIAFSKQTLDYAVTITVIRFTKTIKSRKRRNSDEVAQADIEIEALEEDAGYDFKDTLQGAIQTAIESNPEYSLQGKAYDMSHIPFEPIMDKIRCSH